MKIYSSRLCAAKLLATLLLVLPVTSWAQLYVFACFQGQPGSKPIAGDSMLNMNLVGNASDTGCIAIESIAYSSENILSIGSTSSGAGAGKVSFNPLTITKRIDKSSPALFLNLANGKFFRSVNFIFVNMTGQTHFAPFSIQLGLVGISKIEGSATAGDDALREIITLEYGGIKIQSLDFDKTGKPLTTVSASTWNRVRNVEALDASVSVPNVDLFNISTKPLEFPVE